ncbi:hypothetical protein BASA81_001975 [Batrachochytrium salamandrivorans]|nr:hypothetical protein BASA81_001975 [Batrachochytrium salamandrivorans]
MATTSEVPFGEDGAAAADEFKRVAREGVRKIRLALEKRAPSKLVETASLVENSPHVQGLLGTSVPFAMFLCVLGLKTLLSLFAPSFIAMITLDIGLITLHIWLNTSPSTFEQQQTKRFQFSKDAVFEFTPTFSPSPLPPTTTVTEELPPTIATTTHNISLKLANCLPQPGVHKMSFRDADWIQFKVRQVGYSKTKSKAASEESIYQLIRLDLIRDHLTNVGNHVSLPQVTPLSPNPLTLPNLFIVNAQIPDKSPSMFGGKNKDDLGFSLVFYFQLKPWAIAQEQIHPGIKLLKRYVSEHATTPDIRRRFKSIGIVYNIQHLGNLATLVDTYNGKPAILNKTATVFQANNYFEIDISVFDFPYLPLKGLSSIKEMVAGLGLRAGFLLQGEGEDELPEVLLGGGEFCLDFASANRL